MTEQTTPTDEQATQGTLTERATPTEQATGADKPKEPQAVVASVPPMPVAPPVAAADLVPPGAIAEPVPPVAIAEPVGPDEPVKTEPVKKDRRILRAVLRWTAAAVVFAAVGTSAAYGITRMERTDVPGLATEPDGRWDYPTITRPPLPSGSPAPFAEANKSGSHYADLRKLVLPAPKGAKDDAALRGEDGWLASGTFLAEYAAKEDRESLRQLLTDYGLRNIAARGWTTPDGTHTRIYLLHFDTAAVADELMSTELTYYDSPQFAVRGAPLTERDEKFPERAAVDEITRFAYVESKPYGAEQVRQAYLSAGDTVAVIVQSRKGTAQAVPFQQTVILQSQLLG
ncbi:hypothetical protein [Streptomyces sp. NPDC058476]|uniref:hypothetical protein n=1 Tax=Streptomyces sp. NPDC058476 TaxID=3346519 RepID=UPI00366991BA